MQCTGCPGQTFTKAGRERHGRQLYRCNACGRRISARSGSAFRGYRFPDDIIARAVRWYLRYKLSYADVTEWLAERGVIVDPRLHLRLGPRLHPTLHRCRTCGPLASRDAVACRRNLPEDWRALALPLSRDRCARPYRGRLAERSPQCSSGTSILFERYRRTYSYPHARHRG